MGRAWSLSLVCTLACGLGASAQAPQAAPAWGLAAWVCGDGDLGPSGTRYAAGLERAGCAQGWSVALQVDRGRGGGVRTTVGAGGQIARAGGHTTSMGSADALAEFLTWAGARTPARRRALVIYGHGPGAGNADLLAGDALLVDESSGDALTGSEVAEAVRRSGLALDLLVVDACYGARAETLWAVRASAGTVVVFAGRAPSMGVPWEAAGVRGAAATGGPEMAGAIMAATAASAGGGVGPVAIRGGALQTVADAATALREALEALGVEGDTVLATARAGCADRGPGRELCDLRELSARLSVLDMAAAVPAERVMRAIDGCLTRPLGAETDAPSGVLMWMPGGVPTDLPAVAHAGGFAAMSGWAGLVERYALRRQELLRRTLETPQRGQDAA